ncbi:hypothetical protein PHLCEN_2v11367 [Hermanssonia centrifuga]|uniref:F-box domain-containing protein n=1 Tax=Hermanssonia centrifuga TaxID=98765 RepID=A0A2R6NKL0_9APHY|nr:hypothetical protein PHLCEN_2v11367 [Hermanssonia centrifuga]
MANVVHIPELVDHIVANLESSKRSLLACSLVSSTWYLCVRPYLFHTVCLQLSKISTFPTFIKSTNSIGQYIQKLCFRSHRNSSLPYVNSAILAPLLPHLPCLHSLHFLGVGIRSAGEAPVPQPEPRRKIHSLEFHFNSNRWDKYTSQDVLDILGLFSHADELRLSYDDTGSVYIIPRGNTTVPVPIPGHTLTISILVLKSAIHGYSPLLISLAETRSVIIECLDVEMFSSGMHEKEWEDLGTLTHTYRATIQTLIFKPRADYWVRTPLVLMRRIFFYLHSNLPNLQSLQSFTLYLEIPEGSESTSQKRELKTWTLLSGSLLNLPTSLRHIKLVLLPQMISRTDVMPPPPIRLWFRDELSWKVIRKALHRLTALETATFASVGSILASHNPEIHHDEVLVAKIKARLQLARSIVIRHETVERRSS